MIELFHTHVGREAIDNVTATLREGWLSEGKGVAAFEKALANRFGITNPVCINSGTSALHLALLAAGVGPGDEVIIPPQTFVATGLAVLYCGAKVVFADIDPATGCLDQVSLSEKISSRTRAVIPVDWVGYPADIAKAILPSMIYVIEDAAQALGAWRHGVPIGSPAWLSDMTCFSFQATKHLTTGDGGCVTSRSPEDAITLRRLRWFGIDRTDAVVGDLGERIYTLSGRPGHKYHMNDVAASIGIGNLAGIEKRLERRRTIANQYNEAFDDIAGLELPAYDNGLGSAYWAYLLLADDARSRRKWMEHLRGRGIGASVIHQRIDKHPIFGADDQLYSLPGMCEFDYRQFHIPCHDALTDSEVAYIIDSVRRGW